MIDLNNPMFVCPLSPQAEWKRALLVELGRIFRLDTIVETGTCYGGTVEAVMPHFKHVYSVEVEHDFHKIAMEKFARHPNVSLVHGSSSEMLPAMLRAIAPGPLLFWLDAHITGGTTINLGDQVAGELDTIVRMRPDSLVLVDDCREVNGGFAGPDAAITIPNGWEATFLHGVLILREGGRYEIPERF